MTSLIEKPDGKSLLLLPCCARKASGGARFSVDPLAESVSSECYSNVIATRSTLLGTLLNSKKYTSGQYQKNTAIRKGRDFGLQNNSGSYLAATARYKGNLYVARPDLESTITKNTNSIGQPKLLILSALYGPLHPLSPIQDYNLQMSDSPANKAWRYGFADFLENYVDSQEIERIHLFFGSTTAYYKIALATVTQLKRKMKLAHVYHHEIRNGNSFHTPHNHGLLLYETLSGDVHLDYTRETKSTQL